MSWIQFQLSAIIKTLNKEAKHPVFSEKAVDWVHGWMAIYILAIYTNETHNTTLEMTQKTLSPGVTVYVGPLIGLPIPTCGRLANKSITWSKLKEKRHRYSQASTRTYT